MVPGVIRILLRLKRETDGFVDLCHAGARQYGSNLALMNRGSVMAKTILIINGHPDPSGEHFCDALAEAYAEGGRAGGHEVHRLDIARLEFPWLQRANDFEKGDPPPVIREAQRAIEAADHLVFVYPLWLGDMPALLKAFLEQVFRPAFVTESEAGMGGFGQRHLKGKSARIVVTMGMPAFFYRLFYRAHSVNSFRRNILRFCGFNPVRTSLISVSMILASGLSFLGLGVRPPAPEWGLMLNTLRTAIYAQPWVAALPGFMIFATSISFNLLSDSLRSAMDLKS
jgi:putative NADPH-quinone reductase